MRRALAGDTHRIGRYELLSELAVGGMASVHFGRLLGAEGFTRFVAIKRLLPQLSGDAEFVRMFLNEARLVARVRHPNVIPTLDVVTSGRELLLVMEFVAGVSLSRLTHLIREQGLSMPLPIFASLATGVLHGLHAAHVATNEAGEPLQIVHRDVSPQNIMVGEDGSARIFDFGIAKASEFVEATKTGEVKGKAAYMAPEQASKREQGPWTDIYAAGVVFWEAICGQRLFSANDWSSLARRASEPISMVAPHVLNADCPVALSDVILRALSFEPERRFQSARAMAEAIEFAVPPASSASVADWLQSVIGDELRLQRSRIAQLEKAAGEQSPPRMTAVRRQLAALSDGTHEVTPEANFQGSIASEVPRSSTGWWAFAQRHKVVGLSSIAIAVSLWSSRGELAHRWREQASPTPVSATLLSSPTVATSTKGEKDLADALPKTADGGIAVTEAPARETKPVPSTSHSASVSRPAPVTGPPTARKATVKRRAPSTPSSASDTTCSPPYVVDARGIRYFKPNCL